MAYRIVDWDEHFENNRTRKMVHMRWIPVSNDLADDGYCELVEHPNGAAHLGAWLALVELASKCQPRGTLLRDSGTPHDTASIARITRLPQKVFGEMISRVINMKWVEVCADPAPSCGNPAPIAHPTDEEGKEGKEGKGREQAPSSSMQSDLNFVVGEFQTKTGWIGSPKPIFEHFRAYLEHSGKLSDLQDAISGCGLGDKPWHVIDKARGKGKKQQETEEERIRRLAGDT